MCEVAQRPRCEASLNGLNVDVAIRSRLFLVLRSHCPHSARREPAGIRRSSSRSGLGFSHQPFPYPSKPVALWLVAEGAHVVRALSIGVQCALSAPQCRASHQFTRRPRLSRDCLAGALLSRMPFEGSNLFASNVGWVPRSILTLSSAQLRHAVHAYSSGARRSGLATCLRNLAHEQLQTWGRWT